MVRILRDTENCVKIHAASAISPREPRGGSGFRRSLIRRDLGLRSWLAFDVHDIRRLGLGSHFRVGRRLPVKLVPEYHGHLLARALGLDLGRPNHPLHGSREELFALPQGGHDLRLDLAMLLAGVDVYAPVGREWELLAVVRKFAHYAEEMVRNTPAAAELKKLYERDNGGQTAQQ